MEIKKVLPVQYVCNTEMGPDFRTVVIRACICCTERIGGVWVCEPCCSAQGYGSQMKAASLGQIKRLQTCDMEAHPKEVLMLKEEKKYTVDIADQ